jgi:putative Mg2+ transporter-C (MgtC) family protein
VVGIGFLGAGVILVSEGRVTGLTTASSIWVAAALGMGVGLGNYGLVAMATVLVILVLWLFTRFDRLIDVVGREVRTYEITYGGQAGKTDEIEKRIADSGLKTVGRRRMKMDEERLYAQWELRGPLARHAEFIDAMLEDPDIISLKH